MKKAVITFVCFLLLLSNSYANELLLESANTYKNSLLGVELPQDVRNYAYAILIFPKIKGAALLFGVISGDGVMVELDSFGNIIGLEYVRLSGASFGLQLGYESLSGVMFALKPSLVNDIKNGKLNLDATFVSVFGDKKNLAQKGDMFFILKNSGVFLGASLRLSSIKANGLIDKASEYPYIQLLRAISKG